MIAHDAQGRPLRYALCVLGLCLGVGSTRADERRPYVAPSSAGPVLHSSGLDIRLPRTHEGGEGPHTYDLDLDAVTPAAQARLGGRSGRLRLTVDCKRSLFRAERLSVFQGPERLGGQEEVRLPDEWVRGVRGTYLPALGDRLCSPDAAASGDESTTAASRAAGDNATVQLGSFKSAAAAESAWIALRRRDKTAGRRPHQVETAWVGEARAYRLLVVTRSSGEAGELCRLTRAMRQPCMVRQAPKAPVGRGGPAPQAADRRAAPFKRAP